MHMKTMIIVTAQITQAAYMKCGGKGIVTARKNIVAAKKTATCSSTFTAAGNFLPTNLAKKRAEKVNEFARKSQ